MAESESKGWIEEDLEDPEIQMKNWQVYRAVIDYKRGHLTADEAAAQISCFMDAPEILTCGQMLLRVMKHEHANDLKAMFPKTLGPEPPAPDFLKATRKKNAARRRASGVDAVDRPVEGYYARYADSPSTS